MTGARAFPYLLLVVTCTVVAALGGHQIGVRTHPSAGATALEREQELRAAVRAAVRAQKAEDRRLRRRVLAKAMRWQRGKFNSELTAKVAEARLAEAANAARAYRRGRAAGRATAERALAAREAEEASDEREDEPVTAASADAQR